MNKKIDAYMFGQILGTHSFLLKGDFLKPDEYSEIQEQYFLPGGETGTAVTVLDSLGMTVRMDGTWIGHEVAPMFKDFYKDKNVDLSPLKFTEDAGIMDYVIITGLVRTPMGHFQKLFSSGKRWWNIPKEEDNYNFQYEDDEDNLIDKEENEKLRIILEQNDFNTINEYIENNFKDLPLEEMATKLQRFTSENREKLLNSIKEYSEHFAQNDNNQMDVENDNNNNNNMNQMQTMNNMGMINPNYGINMYQNESGINQMYMGGINNMNNMQQQQNSNNVNNMNPNLQQMYYNQGMNIYNNYNPNFK